MCTRKRSGVQAVHDARKAVEEITVPPSAGRSEPATKTVVQAIAVAQALRSRVAHRLHYIASQTGILDADSDSSSTTRCSLPLVLAAVPVLSHAHSGVHAAFDSLPEGFYDIEKHQQLWQFAALLSYLWLLMRWPGLL